MSDSSYSKLELWKKALLVFCVLAMAPIAGLTLGILLVTVAPAIALVAWPLLMVSARNAAPGVPPESRSLPVAPRPATALHAAAH